ncbi:MAG: hypothetical protein ACP5OG_04545 [Candidatus Nanoarchaeia archaeon]
MDNKENLEIPDFDFPIFNTPIEHFDKYLDRKLPLELFLKHEGYEFIVEGVKYNIEISDSRAHPKDFLELNISTYIGICPDARHYYGSLNLPFFNFREKGTNNYCCGFGFPNVLYRVYINKILTKEDLEKNKDYFTGGYREGRYYNGFDSKDEVVLRAKEVTNKHFPGFKLLIPEQI